MSDPIGNNAGGKSASGGDMQIAFDGGRDFMARVNFLSAKKIEHDEALEQLRLGKSAKEAFDEAARKLEDAKAAHAEAAAVLGRAKANAAALVEDAQKQASSVVAAAEAAARSTTQAAAKAKNEADRYASDSKTAADAVLADVKSKQAALEASLIEVKKRADDHDVAVEAARIARKGATDKQAKLQAKIDRLHEVIREITGG